jgi:DNA-binding transcriptional regulator LsrR (DeoR family)
MAQGRAYDRLRRRPEPITDAEVHRAAKLHVTGLAANAIARRMYPERCKTAAGLAWAITRVRRLLSRALERGVISVRLAREDLAAQLGEQFKARFHVIDDEMPGAETVYQEAARLIVDRVEALLHDPRAHGRRIVIANAGGLALSRVAEYLSTFAVPDIERGDRLLFVALNALRRADSYHLSANHVAVRMATVFGGRHLAMLTAPSAAAQYDEALKHIDLLICGAGSSAGYLPEWIRDDGSPSKTYLPETVVGDVCLIPLDERGREVTLPEAIAQRIRRELSPQPGYERLRQLAVEDRVLVVLMAPAGATSLKVPIARAMLGRLTGSCVLGVSLAAALRDQADLPKRIVGIRAGRG